MTETPDCILLLDTSGDVGTVAVAAQGELRTMRKMERAKDYAAVLNETVADALTEAGASLDVLTAICVLAGPGSYTGLRIALAAAKGWCYALDVPLFLQNGLRVLAEEARAAKPGYEGYVAVLPARQGEYFFAACDGTGSFSAEPRHLKLSDAANVLHALPARCIAIGSEAVAAELFSQEGISCEVAETLARSTPSVEAWLKVSLAQIKAGGAADLAYAEPFYLKAAYTTTPKASR